MILLLLAASTILVPRPGEAQWPTTDWQVLCYDPPPRIWLAPDGSGDQAAYEAYKETVGSYSDDQCDDSEAGSVTNVVRQELEEISEWLEGQGFPAPNVPLIDGRFQALYVPSEFMLRRVCYRGACAVGRSFYAYEGSTTRAENATLPNALLLQAEGDERGLAHELFHAVQHAFAPFQGVDQSAEVANWVKEGTAEAVGRTWSTNAAHARLSSRDFSEPLQRRAPRQAAYDDEAFWRAVSREYTEGETYGFLKQLFDEALAGDELAAVDRTFRKEFGSEEGLEDVYPQVAARHFDEKRFYSELAKTADNAYRFELAFPDTVERLGHTASDVAANGYLVRMEVPEEKEGHLTIRVPPDRDEEYLHLIVDDMRRDAPGTTGRRNEYTTDLPAGPHEFLVRLVNVPSDLSDVDPSVDPAPIEFILVELDASWTLTVSGGPAPGTYRGDLAVASIDRAGRITHVGLYTGTDVRPDVVVSVLPPADAGYEPGVPAPRGQFSVILNYGDPERVHLDVDSYTADRIGLFAAPERHPPPTVKIERVTEETVKGFAEGGFWQDVPEVLPDQLGTMRVEFRARACRVGDPDFSACTSLQPVSW